MDTRLAEPTTVGEMLREEFLKPLNITQEQLAQKLGTNRKSIGLLLANKRRMTLDEAAALAQLFEVDDNFWVNLQAAHDRWEVRMLNSKRRLTPISTAVAAFA